MSLIFLIVGLILELNKKEIEDWSGLFVASVVVYLVELFIFVLLSVKGII